MRRVGCQAQQRGAPAATAVVLEAPLREVFEDHLGAALIRPGDTVTIKKSGFGSRLFPWEQSAGAIRVEPRAIVPYI